MDRFVALQVAYWKALLKTIIFRTLSGMFICCKYFWFVYERGLEEHSLFLLLLPRFAKVQREKQTGRGGAEFEGGALSWGGGLTVWQSAHFIWLKQTLFFLYNFKRKQFSLCPPLPSNLKSAAWSPCKKSTSWKGLNKDSRCQHFFFSEQILSL